MSKCILRAVFCVVLSFLFSCGKNETPAAIPFNHKDGDVITMLRSEASKPVNVVIVGDGFKKADLFPDGEFDKQAKGVVDYLFNTAPFSSYKEFFNVYEVYTESNDGNVGSGNLIDNKFGTYLNKGNFIVDNPNQVKAYAQKAVANGTADILILLANTPQEGNYSNSNFNIVTSSAQSYPYLLHTLGHLFVRLGDEFISADMANNYPKSQVANYPNLDVVSDPAKVKWASYLKLADYRSTVNVYEGGYFVAKGVYRPEANSVMRDPKTSSTYNAPSREAIAKRICQLSGTPFTINDFLARDNAAVQITPPEYKTSAPAQLSEVLVGF